MDIKKQESKKKEILQQIELDNISTAFKFIRTIVNDKRLKIPDETKTSLNLLQDEMIHPSNTDLRYHQRLRLLVIKLFEEIQYTDPTTDTNTKHKTPDNRKKVVIGLIVLAVVVYIVYLNIPPKINPDPSTTDPSKENKLITDSSGKASQQGTTKLSSSNTTNPSKKKASGKDSKQQNTVNQPKPKVYQSGDVKIIGGIEMVFVKGGRFIMGKDDPSVADFESSIYNYQRPAHQVIVSDFWISKYEITCEQYQAYCDKVKNATFPKKLINKPDKRPIACVLWDDAKGYCNWLRGVTGSSFRLPTEAEWEYAARGGNKKENYWYAGSDYLEEVANTTRVNSVGVKKANGLEIYDMSGNVWEWVYDYYNADYYKKCDSMGTIQNPCDCRKPTTDGQQNRRVGRGGGFDADSEKSFRTILRNSYNLNSTTVENYPHLGFRVVISNANPNPCNNSKIL